MPAHPVTHPSADALRAFALGKLNDSTAAVLMNHLDGCRDCCKQVAAISGDDFLARLRQARGQSSTSRPAQALSETAGGRKPEPNQPDRSNVPPELAVNEQYEIQRELGRGGMGVVYLAKNKLMDRLEVLKVVNKALLDHAGAVERFLREIRSAAKLSHANVVAAYHALQVGELLAFAMEYIEGQDLASLVKSQGPLPIPHACFYVQQAAHGLQHAFEKGMVHRDIKPQNLILAREGKKHIVKVLDFGLAKVMREKKDDASLTGEGKMLGTPDYIAPEQTMDAAHADIRADIYSLGCTLYYLLSGHPPFSGSSLGAILVAHQMHEAKPLNLERPEVPEELAAVVRKMMAKTPAKRYQKPLEVVQALSPFVKQGTTAKAALELSAAAVEAKPIVKKAALAAPPPVPVPQTPKQQPEPAAVRDSLTDDTSASVRPRKSAVISKRRAATVRERTAQQKRLIGGGLGVGVLLLALLAMWTSGLFKAKTKHAIRNAEVNEPLPKAEKPDSPKRFKVQPGYKGEWSIEGDQLVQSSQDINVALIFGDTDWKDYDFAVEAMRGKGNDGVCQLFRTKEGGYFYGLGHWNNSLYSLEKISFVSREHAFLGRNRSRIDTGEWCKMRVRVRGKHIQCFLNDAKIFDCEDADHPSGCVGLRTWATHYRFRNIKVTAADGTVLLEGLPDLK